MLDDALAQKEILLPAPRKRPRWTFDDPGCGDGLAIPELLVRQVEVHTAGQPIPPVKSVLFPAAVDLPDHEVATEDVIHYQSGDVTVTPRRVAGLPAGAGEVVRGTGVSGPTGPQSLVDDQQVPRDHADSIAVATDIGGSPGRRLFNCRPGLGLQVSAQSFPSSRNEEPLIDDLAQFGLCQPALPGDLARVRDQGFSHDSLMHPKPHGADPLPAKELEHEAHGHTNAQLFGQFPGRGFLIRLTHVHGATDHHVVVAREPGMRLGPSQHQDPPCPITADRRRNAMRPVLTLRLASFDDSQHAVLLIYMLHQFAHGGTISVPTDSEAPGTRKRVTCITGGPAEYNTADHLRRESRLCDRTCSIATRSHPHTASADTSHSYVTHLTEDGVDRRFIQQQVGHECDSSLAIYTHVSDDFMNTSLQNALAPAFVGV